MFTGALQVSKAWGTGLNRLGWGCLSLIGLIWAFSEPLQISIDSLERQTLGASAFVMLLFALLLSALLGSFTLTLGSALHALSKFDLNGVCRLAEKIGQTGNPLLIQMYNDALLRYEIAAGARGCGMLLTICMIANWALSDTTVESNATPIGPWPEPYWWIPILLLALIYNWLLDKSSTEVFEALSRVSTDAHSSSSASK